MMTIPRYTGPLVVAALVGFSGDAFAQQGCQNEIQQLRSQIQQGQANQEERQQVSRLLDQAQQAGAQNCDRYVQQARQQLDQLNQTSGLSRQTQQPEGEVGVQQTSQARPSQENMNVEIQQSPAEVEVNAAAPEVIVHQEPPRVTVEQQPPRVEIRQPEAEVSVTQAEPQVTVNQAEPNVRIEQAEPQVQITQAGEPEVRMVGGDDAEIEEEQTAGTSGLVQDDTRQQGTSTTSGSQISESEASQLLGSRAVSRDDEEVGDISAVVQDRTGDQLYAVVDVGGFLGIGARSVAIPIERASINQEGDLQVSMTRDELEDLPEYDSEDYRQYGLIQ